MAQVAPAERVEEMPRWPTLMPEMFEVAPLTCQNLNSANYSDWGNTSFNENRRHPFRSKGHRNSRRNNQQPSWAAECAPVPASPQWQPQPPAVTDASFNGYQQEPQGPIAVNLQGLPYALCRQPFLEAMLDQAGLADDIMGCVLGEDQDTGKAVIYLANYNAALKCVQHFGGRRWEQAGPPVTAQVAEGQCPQPANVPPARAAGTRTRKSRGAKNGQEQQNAIPMPPPLPIATPGHWMMPQPMIPFMGNVQEYQKGSDLSPKMAGRDSPNAGSNGSNSPKNRWADLTDEEEKENDLSEGLEGSTSAGSTGRNSKDSTGEGFFFGCDVDTDDGF